MPELSSSPSWLISPISSRIFSGIRITGNSCHLSTCQPRVDRGRRRADRLRDGQLDPHQPRNVSSESQSVGERRHIRNGNGLHPSSYKEEVIGGRERAIEENVHVKETVDCVAQRRRRGRRRHFGGVRHFGRFRNFSGFRPKDVHHKKAQVFRSYDGFFLSLCDRFQNGR